MAANLPPGDYYAIVARASEVPNAQVYAWTIQPVLPAIPIPLRASDTDINLNLREAFDLTYDRGRYARLLQCGKSLPDTLPLASADRTWAESIGRYARLFRRTSRLPPRFQRAPQRVAVLAELLHQPPDPGPAGDFVKPAEKAVRSALSKSGVSAGTTLFDDCRPVFPRRARPPRILKRRWAAVDLQRHRTGRGSATREAAG